MRCLLAQKQMDRTAWPRILQEVYFVHNAQSNASTGFSPNEVMYGTRLRTNIDAAIPAIEDPVYTDMDEYYEVKTKNNSSINSEVSENIERAQYRMKKYYDSGTKMSEIASGDLVLVKDEYRPDTLSPVFRGPWTVTERRGVNLHIDDPNTGKIRVVHINRCKKAEPRTPDHPIYDVDPDVVADTSARDTSLDETKRELEDTPFVSTKESERPRRQRRPPDRYGDWTTEYIPNTFEGESGVK